MSLRQAARILGVSLTLFLKHRETGEKNEIANAMARKKNSPQNSIKNKKSVHFDGIDHC